MAGTSLDGVDAALVAISGPADQPRVELLGFATAPYPGTLRRRLLRVAGGEPATTGEISELNFQLGERFAQGALAVCLEARLPASRLAFIGSHGQTIYHRGSAARGSVASTLQIAEPSVIAERTGAAVVADFRAADIAAGGQGAPLVPLVDYLLLRDAKLGTVALNVGGIANVTIIPPHAGPEDVSGFDTGPGNIIMDALVRHFTHGRRDYDPGGGLASRGRVAEPLLRELLRLSFFRHQPPKSAGREQFGSEFVGRYFLARRTKTRPSDFHDLLRTANELTAGSIVDALRRFVFRQLKPGARLHRLIVSGGGARNHLLMRRLRVLLPELSVKLSDEYGLPADAKEAIAFAVLADRTMQGLAGNLPGVTGARREVVLGKIVWPAAFGGRRNAR